MIKNKFVKGLMLGIAISSLYTATAFAQMVDDATVSVGGQTDVEYSVLYEQQRELDQLLFVDHVKELETKGIQVNYTGVAEDHIEIGITPYNDENVMFVNNLLGNQDIKVVDSDDVVLYTTQEVTEPAAASGQGEVPVTKEAEELAATSGLAADTDTVEIAPDTPISNQDAMDAREEEIKIQIEAMEDQTIVYDEEESVPDRETMEIQLASSAEDGVIAQSDIANDTDEQKDGLSTTMLVLIIAGGALILGGGILAVTKKGI